MPGRSWLVLGPGWAALAGALAAGEFRFETDSLLKLGLIWLLVDPILGTIWHLVADKMLWRRLWQPFLPPGVSLKPSLPYTVKGSPAYKFLVFRARLQTDTTGEGYTLFIAIGLSLFIAAILGLPVILYAIISIFLAFLVGEKIFIAGSRGHFLCAAATFLLPYLVGVFIIAKMIPLYALLLGIVYLEVYFGLLQLNAGKMQGERLVVAGPGAMAMLLFGLMKPLPAMIVALGALFSLLLRFEAQKQDVQAATWYGQQLRLFLWSGLLISAWAIGDIHLIWFGF